MTPTSDSDMNYFDEHAYQVSSGSEQELTRNDVVYDMFVVTCRRVNSNGASPAADQIPPSYNQAMTMFQTSSNSDGTRSNESKEQPSSSQTSGNITTDTTAMFAAVSIYL